MDYNLAAWQNARGGLRTLTAISWVRDLGSAVVGTGRERVRGARAASNLLATLGVRPVVGRWFTPNEEQQLEPVVVLSHALWRRQYAGDPSVVGRERLLIDDRLLTVIGVLPPAVGFPTKAEFWYPNPNNLGAEVIARVRPGTPLTSVQRELRARAPGIEVNRASGVSIDFGVVTLHERLYGANEPILRLLMGTVMLLLALAYTNVANLTLARVLERQRELAMCVALGASRRRLIAFVLAENAILATAAGIAGAVLSVWVTGLLVRVRPPELAGVVDARVGVGGLFVAAAAGIVAALTISIAPVLGIVRADLRTAVGQPSAVGRNGAAGNRTRGALVVTQLAIALLLVTASGLLIRSMRRLTRIDTGFDRGGLVIARLRFVGESDVVATRQRDLVKIAIERLQALPGVRSVTTGPPPLVGGRGPGFSDGYNNIVSIRDSTVPGAPSRSLWIKYVDPSYFETFGIRILAGRLITFADDAGAPAVALINATAEPVLFPDGPALGRQLKRLPITTAQRTSGGRPITVVGLLPDVRQRDVTIAAYPEIWLPIAQQQNLDRDVYVSARTEGNAETLARTVHRILGQLDPQLKLQRVLTMDALVRETLAPQRYVLAVLGAFAALALGLATLGLYAMMAYQTTTRTREIGVRMALGARPGQVLSGILGDGLRLVALGTAIGLPIAYASSHAMGRFLYEIHPRDVRTFVAAPAVLVLAALLAAYFPARRATKVDPVTALRVD
jgi:putative ABC transport system permease protein